MTQKQRLYPQDDGGWSRWLPYLIPLFTLIALALLIYASSNRTLATARALSQEDAVIMNWWQTDKRSRLNAQAGMIAQRLGAVGQATDSAGLAELAAAAGLSDHDGYVAWIDGTKLVRSELNTGSKLGDPGTSKLFSFVPAVGYPGGDFWHEDGQAYWMSMAPVDPELGGGAVVVQSPVNEALLDKLAAAVGRDVSFYSYEEQQPLASSNPSLIADPPVLNATWMNEVAAGQLPDTTSAANSAEDFIVAMLAFGDFAGISFSGYLAMLEPTAHVASLLPITSFWVATLVATLLALLGAFLLARMYRRYMQSFRTLTTKERRSAKVRMGLVAIAALVPAFVAAGYILFATSNSSAELDLRTSQIAKTILAESAGEMAARVNEIAGAETASTLPAESADELATALVAAHGVEFALVEGPDGVVQQGVEELNEASLAALSALPAGSTELVTAGKAVYLASHQPTEDGSGAIAGIRLHRYLSNMNDVSDVEVSVLNGQEMVGTTLVEREIESIFFDDAIESELAQNGEVSYLQKVGWNPGRLTLSRLDVGAGENDYRFLVSQPSVTWSNNVRGFQGIGLALLAALVVLVALILTTMMNRDKPLLLRRIYTGYLFLLPALVWLIWWQLGPALFAGYLSFHKWSVLTPAKPFVGLHNYRQIMEDEKFWNAMKNTFIYVTQIPVGMALALALAMALNRPLRGIKALRTIYYMPAVTSIVVVSLMWRLLYNKDLGVFNYLLSFVGLGPYGFLQSPTGAMPSIMAMAIWLGLGARMLLFLAGLQSIPNDLYEAADVDGANGWNKFRHVTIPLLAPTTFFVFITSIIASFQVFGPVYVLTQGGPAGATDVAVHRIYFEAWQNLRFGYASAETVILFAFLFVATAIQFRYFGRNVSYG